MSDYHTHTPDNPLCSVIKVDSTTTHVCKDWKGHESDLHNCKCGYSWKFNSNLVKHIFTVVKTNLHRYYITGPVGGSKQVLKFSLNELGKDEVFNNAFFTVTGGKILVQDLTGKILVEEGDINVYKDRFYTDYE